MPACCQMCVGRPVQVGNRGPTRRHCHRPMRPTASAWPCSHPTPDDSGAAAEFPAVTDAADPDATHRQPWQPNTRPESSPTPVLPKQTRRTRWRGPAKEMRGRPTKLSYPWTAGHTARSRAAQHPPPPTNAGGVRRAPIAAPPSGHPPPCVARCWRQQADSRQRARSPSLRYPVPPTRRAHSRPQPAGPEPTAGQEGQAPRRGRHRRHHPRRGRMAVSAAGALDGAQWRPGAAAAQPTR